MGTIAVLASGNGSNFEALTLALRQAGHGVCLLLCDRSEAFALRRAERLGVPARIVRYRKDDRPETEREMIAAIEASGATLVALAGFMRLLGPVFVRHFEGRLVNIHPSLLPAWPGTHSIERAWAAGDATLGVTVHYVDEGMDTGTVIEQSEVARQATLEATEAAIHATEHLLYPRVVIRLLETPNPAC